MRLREVLVGIEGVALVRRLFTGSDEEAQRRIDEVGRILADAEGATLGMGADVTRLEVADGYARWAATYDGPDNPLISVEQPVVRAILDGMPPARVLDAACGTGRHARYLAERGHHVTGVDVTPEMLARAQASVPTGRFLLGDVCDLPLENAGFDLAVCALALDHVEDLELSIAQLTRVVRPGGRVIISCIHPILSVLGAVAYFRDVDGESAFVRGHFHSHADYLTAIVAAGLQLRVCIEAPFGRKEVEMQQPARALVPEAAEAAYLGLPAVLVWDAVRQAEP